MWKLISGFQPKLGVSDSATVLVFAIDCTEPRNILTEATRGFAADTLPWLRAGFC